MQWSLQTVTGEVPPPCSGFSFTLYNSDHVVLFGGYSDVKGRMDDVYILNLAQMVRMSHLFC